MRRVTEIFGAKSRPYWTAPAPALGIPAPVVELLQDEVNGDVRTVRLRMKSMRAAPELKLFAEGVEVLSATMQGRSVLAAPKEDWLFSAYNLPAEGTELSMRVKAGRPFFVRVIDTTYGLPAVGLAARSPGMVMRPFGVTDSVRAFTSIGFN